MPRAKKPKKRHIKLCMMCPVEFECDREDKETCSPRCRQRLSREKRSARIAHKKFNPFNAVSGTVCGDCGVERDGRVLKCPVCGAVRIPTTAGDRR